MPKEKTTRRKIDSECRSFKEEWCVKYFVIEKDGKGLCLICNDNIAVLKEYNMRRHYQTKHSQQYSQFEGKDRLQKLDKLKRNLSSQQSFFTKARSENEAVTKASFRVAHLLAKRGKPFTDGELIKSCMISVAEEICPENVNLFKAVSLSARTIARRVEDIGNNITNQLKTKTKKFEWFSIALDESTDVVDTAQLLLFIRGIDDNFEVTEELASINSLHGTTTGDDIFKEVEKTLVKYNLHWNKLKCITTDGGRNMCGTEKGVVGRIFKACEDEKCSKPIVIHCVIHQQALCGKYLNLSCVMEPVVSTVNFIRSRGLNHRQFREFLSELESEYSDLQYHTAVRWLSSGKVLLRFFELKFEIEIFLKNKNHPQPLLADIEWLWKLAFFADLLKFFNEFNLQLQGQTALICNTYTAVKAFRNKFILFESHIKSNNFVHFPCCQTLKEEGKSAFPDKFAADIFVQLKQQFQQRFSDFDIHAKEISIFENPFNCAVEELPANLQLEVINLQCDERLKAKYNEKDVDLIDFYKNLPNNQYENLKSFARQFISIFSSTYLCEKTFSTMKYVKSRYRSALTDENLQSILKISTTNFEPEINELVSNIKQFHLSH